MTAPIAAFYAALLALLFVGLSVRVIRERYRARVALGSGGAPALERAIRVHANFAEYVPLALILLLLAELSRCPALGLHLAGVLLVAGRCLHAWGVSRQNENFRFRSAGMVATFAVVAGLALYLLGALGLA